jgi:hypothetical protein
MVGTPFVQVQPMPSVRTAGRFNAIVSFASVGAMGVVRSATSPARTRA